MATGGTDGAEFTTGGAEFTTGATGGAEFTYSPNKYSPVGWVSHRCAVVQVSYPPNPPDVIQIPVRYALDNSRLPRTIKCSSSSS